MRSKRFFVGLFAALVSLWTEPGYAQWSQQSPMVVSADRTNGVYQVGETVRWRVLCQDNSTNAPDTARYTLRRGELTETARGDLSFTNGMATLETRMDAPGHLLLEVRTGDRGGWPGRALGGAVAAVERIGLSAARPADFDAFWEAKLKELAMVRANPQLESDDGGRTNVSYWKITLDNVRGSHIYGQLAKPSREGKFPALLILQWAGTPYPLQKSWVTDRAAQGWLALNIEPHDMPIDALDRSRAPANFDSVGCDNRETSYFLRMYLSCYRAAQYLSERPDWDGRTLVATGDSMGGQQTLMIAGLHPKITAALALVPAGCDMLGPLIGRRGGWPQWYDKTNGLDHAKVHEASRYYDVANFASHIKCSVLVGVGLIDETCPPEGVFAAFNQIESPKEMLILPDSPHQNVNGSQLPYTRRKEDAWLPALRDGKNPW
jgi:cephalosporin-C deacetylase